MCILGALGFWGTDLGLTVIYDLQSALWIVGQNLGLTCVSLWEFCHLTWDLCLLGLPGNMGRSSEGLIQGYSNVMVGLNTYMPTNYRFCLHRC